jgi:hypothetical protein
LPQEMAELIETMALRRPPPKVADVHRAVRVSADTAVAVPGSVLEVHWVLVGVEAFAAVRGVVRRGRVDRRQLDRDAPGVVAGHPV